MFADKISVEKRKKQQNPIRFRNLIASFVTYNQFIIMNYLSMAHWVKGNQKPQKQKQKVHHHCIGTNENELKLLFETNNLLYESNYFFTSAHDYDQLSNI